MAPSSKQNEMKVVPSMKILVKVKHINLVTSINEVTIFLANIDELPAANE